MSSDRGDLDDILDNVENAANDAHNKAASAAQGRASAGGRRFTERLQRKQEDRTEAQLLAKVHISSCPGSGLAVRTWDEKRRYEGALIGH